MNLLSSHVTPNTTFPPTVFDRASQGKGWLSGIHLVTIIKQECGLSTWEARKVFQKTIKVTGEHLCEWYAHAPGRVWVSRCTSTFGFKYSIHVPMKGFGVPPKRISWPHFVGECAGWCGQDELTRKHKLAHPRPHPTQAACGWWPTCKSTRASSTSKTTTPSGYRILVGERERLSISLSCLFNPEYWCSWCVYQHECQCEC